MKWSDNFCTSAYKLYSIYKGHSLYAPLLVINFMQCRRQSTHFRGGGAHFQITSLNFQKLRSILKILRSRTTQGELQM